jgi:DNA transformation protein and related proteins
MNSAANDPYVALAEEIFQSIAPVTTKKFFGAIGVYAQGVIIGCLFDDDIMLKADSFSAPQFEAAGCKQWAYEHNKTGKQVKMPYWSIPEDAFDDPDVMATWVKLALDAGLRAKK